VLFLLALCVPSHAIIPKFIFGTVNDKYLFTIIFLFLNILSYVLKHFNLILYSTLAAQESWIGMKIRVVNFFGGWCDGSYVDYVFASALDNWVIFMRERGGEGGGRGSLFMILVLTSLFLSPPECRESDTLQS